jgi:imidazolonepropionase-like amidohydrolase
MSFHHIFLYLTTTAAILPAIAEGCFHKPYGSPPTDIGVRRHAVPHTDRVRTALINVRIWDGHKIVKPSTVFIDGGVIVPYIPHADTVIDGHNGVLLPGFIDSHCHPDTISALEDLASYGVSTALSMACYDYNVCNSLRNQVGLAQYFSSGIAAHGPGGIYPGPASIFNASQAGQFVDNVFGNGSDYLKIVAADGGPDQATQNALVASAHAKGKATMTHATNVLHFKEGIISKSDGMQHTPADSLLPPDTISLMSRQKQHVTPTMEVAKLALKIAETNPAILAFLGEGSDASYAVWRSNVMAMHKAGIPILAGTDAAPVIPIKGSSFGWTFHEELANLVDAGLSTAEVLRSATIIPALMHNFPTRGRIAPGMRADLILLSPGSNPIQDIAATKNISRIWIGGLEYSHVATQPFPSVHSMQL